MRVSFPKIKIIEKENFSSLFPEHINPIPLSQDDVFRSSHPEQFMYLLSTRLNATKSWCQLVYYYLRSIANEHGIVPLLLTFKDYAQMLGVARINFSKALNILEDRGLVAIKHKELRIRTRPFYIRITVIKVFPISIHINDLAKFNPEPVSVVTEDGGLLISRAKALVNEFLQVASWQKVSSEVRAQIETLILSELKDGFTEEELKYMWNHHATGLRDRTITSYAYLHNSITTIVNLFHDKKEKARESALQREPPPVLETVKEAPWYEKLIKQSEHEFLLQKSLCMAYTGEGKLSLSGSCLKLAGAVATLYVPDNPYMKSPLENARSAIYETLSGLQPSIKELKVVPFDTETPHAAGAERRGRRTSPRSRVKAA